MDDSNGTSVKSRSGIPRSEKGKSGKLMKRIAQFFKVSPDNFAEAMREEFSERSDEEIREIYER